MATTRKGDVGGNLILAGLPSKVRRMLAADSDRVSLLPGEVLCAAGATIKHAYFPREGVISLFSAGYSTPDVGVGIVGVAGMFGLGIAAGGAKSALHAVSQGHGSADRVGAAALLRLLARSAPLRNALLVYGHGQLEQMAQNTACLAHHPAQMRLARWMLDVTDVACDHVSSTQAATAIALGVDRPAVSRAAGHLQKLGLVRYRRGEITIVDRAGLTAMSCTCSVPSGAVARLM